MSATVAAPAGTLNHHRIGQGEPLVLIHGVGSQWQVWDPVLEPLARERDVIALDLPGFGGSAPLPPGTAPNVSALADAVAGTLDALGIEEPLVVGNSLGGWIALELAKRGITRSVVALSPGGFWSGPEAVWARAQLKIAGFFARRFPAVSEAAARRPKARQLTSNVFYGHPELVPPAAMIEALRNLAASPAYDETVEVNIRDRFSGGDQVRGPVTIAWGELDRLLFPRQAHRAVAAIPQARHVPIADAGHVPTWDRPDEVVRLALDASPRASGL